MTNTPTAGLSREQALALQRRFGKNELTPQKKDSFLKKAAHIIAEPMFLLLLIAALIYFVLGEPRDGMIMLVFVAGIISIDVIQEWKTDRTLSALKDLSAPRARVIRDGSEQEIPSADLVPGDLMLLYEGVKIPADGMIVKCNDLCVDESSLTGEAEGVWKCPDGVVTAGSDFWRKDYCYAGTLVTQGTATVGLIVFAASFGTYYLTLLNNPDNAPAARAMGLAIVMVANLLLVLVNSSDHDSMFHSIRRLVKDKVMWLVIVATIAGLLLILYTPLAGFLKLAPLTGVQLLLVAGIAAVSVLWFELVKSVKRLALHKSK